MTHKVIVYHKTETQASRARRPKAGETIMYKSIMDYDEKLNDQFDEVVMLCVTPDIPPKKGKKGKKADGV